MTSRVAIRSTVFAIGLLALGWRGARAQAAALDTAFERHVGEMARQRASQLLPTPAQPEDNRVVNQYREALADLERGAWSDAATLLQAVLQRRPQNPMYRGDLGYAFLRAGQFDPASREYARASQAQPQNGWFILGIGMSRASQRQFPDAAGAADLAAQTDTSVVDSAFASTAGGWFEAAGDRTRALYYAHLSSQRWPGDAQAWLRISSYLAARNDTTPEGMAAIRRYRTLRPDDKLGMALLAKYLYDIGQTDSAIAIAQFVAADSSYRPFAASVLLQAAGAQLRRDVDKTIQLLTLGTPWADSSMRASYANVMGRAQLRKLTTVIAHYESYPSCDTAHVLDTLVTATERNLRAGMSFDSARTRMMVDSLLPPYKGNAQAALHSCKPEAQLQQQNRRRPRAPARRP